jgi:glutamyl-tRNA reductase
MMSTPTSRLFCLGLNHRTTKVDLREKVAFPAAQVPDAARELQAVEGIDEAVILSTCNRVELYIAHSAGDSAQSKLVSYLTQRFQLSADEAAGLAFYHHDDHEAARHLFRVVSGLDSMVLGETEIFGQVKDAYQTALGAGATGRELNKLFQRAFSVGKLVREKTGIQRGSTSVGSVAVDLAGKIFDLKTARVMIIGAGEMARTCAQSLLSRGAQSVIVSNRNYERAVELATEFKGSAITFESWETTLHEVDIVISSTSAPHFVVTPTVVRWAMNQRRGRPLFLIDIAVPRDIDPTVNDLDEVYVYDIDALSAIAEGGRRERERQLALCEQLIAEQLKKFGFVT